MAKGLPSRRALAFKAWMAAAGTNTSQVAARAGVPYTTLATFVQGGTQSLKGDNEEKIADAYGVAVGEIFAGVTPQMVPIIGRVGADATGEIVPADDPDDYDTAPVPPGGSAKTAALEVIGDSIAFLADDGALIYFEREQTPPTPEMVYYYVIAELEDGRVFLKRLLRGNEPGKWTLESQRGPPIENVRIRWASEPTTIIRPRQAQRIIRRAGESQVA